MEVFTTSKEALTTSMEESINLHRKYIFMRKVGFVKIAKIV